MRRPPRENCAVRAKRRREIRPSIGRPLEMRVFAAVGGLGLIGAISACFNVNFPADCRITCTAAQGCPGNLVCIIDDGKGLCAPPGTMTCSPPDAGTGNDAIDGGNDGADALDGGGDGTDGSDVSTDGGPPSVLCHNGTC